MVFYAFAKNINDDWSWRYIIVFADRDTARGWWRTVSTAIGTAYPNSVKRVNYQFFTHDPNKAIIANSITDPKCAPQYLGKVFFTLLNDRDGRILSTIPEQYMHETDSGSTFFIRSLVDPGIYWFVPGDEPNHQSDNKDVHASRTGRTRFRIRIQDGNIPKGTPMIGSDDVYISLVSDDQYVTVDMTGKLAISSKPEVYKFSDFKNGFIAKGFVVANNEGSADIYKTSDGEKWELV